MPRGRRRCSDWSVEARGRPEWRRPARPQGRSLPGMPMRCWEMCRSGRTTPGWQRSSARPPWRGTRSEEPFGSGPTPAATSAGAMFHEPGRGPVRRPASPPRSRRPRGPARRRARPGGGNPVPGPRRHRPRWRSRSPRAGFVLAQEPKRIRPAARRLRSGPGDRSPPSRSRRRCPSHGRRAARAPPWCWAGRAASRSPAARTAGRIASTRGSR